MIESAIVEPEGDEQGIRGSAESFTRSPLWLQVLGWLWFISCLWLAGKMIAAGGGAAAILYCVSGGMALPPLWRWLATRDVVFSTALRWIIGVLTVFAATMVWAAQELSGPAAPAPKTPVYAPPTSDAEPQVRVGQRRGATDVTDKALEERNKIKIASLIAGEKAMRERDYEGRLRFWAEITALAPGNKAYARNLAEVQRKIAELRYATDNPEQAAVVEDVTPRKAGFGNVLVIDATLRNDSLSNLKDFVLTCDSKGASGTVIDRNTRTLYEMVEARSSRKFRNINMGLLHSQVRSTRCVVERAAIG